MAVWGHRPSWYTLLERMIGLTPVRLWWQVSLDFPRALPFFVWYGTKRLICLLQKRYSLLIPIITMLVWWKVGLGELSRLRQDLLVAPIWWYCNTFWRLFISRVNPRLAYARFALWSRPTVFMLLIWAFQSTFTRFWSILVIIAKIFVTRLIAVQLYHWPACLQFV